jgi:hydroxymethylbilane synthase
VGSINGRRIIKDEIIGNIENYRALGIELAEKLLLKGAGEILEEIYGSD